jgi:hypothetical protein
VLQLRPVNVSGTRAAQPALALTLYPNPTAGSVRLALTIPSALRSQVQVFDLTGRLVQKASFVGSSLELPTQGLSAGTYFVRVQSGTAVAVQRLVVEK